MSLAQSLQIANIDQNQILQHARSVVEKIRSVSDPVHIYLFGSAAEGQFKVGSDLDFVLVYNDYEELHNARKAIRKLGLLCGDIAVDLVFVSKKLFETKKDVGGVCFTAFHEGILL